MRTLITLLSLATLLSGAVVNYIYDAAGRLIRIDQGAAGSIAYTYDKAGNLLSRTVAPPAGSGSLVTSVNVAWGGTDIAPNTFIEIKGVNLVPADTPASGVIWSSAPEFLNGRMPATLGGVSVTINGKPAYIYYFCSAKTSACATDQINVLTGLDATPGPAQLIVKSGATSSAPFTVNVKPLAPAFLLFNGEGYVVATHANFSLLGPRTLYPGATTPALPGETVVIYGVGFGIQGATLTEGSSTQSALLAGLACSVAGTPTSAAGALIAPGLYQVNVKIPDNATSGDKPIACTYNGASTQSIAKITVQ